MFNKHGKIPSLHIDTLLAVGGKIIGDVFFKNACRVDGEIIGNITGEDGQKNVLVLGERAVVKGNISVSNLIIDGMVEGSIIVSGNLQLLSEAKVTGDVRYKIIEMELGAVIRGQLTRHDDSPIPLFAIA